jgi:hypothetical protein
MNPITSNSAVSYLQTSAMWQASNAGAAQQVQPNTPTPPMVVNGVQETAPVSKIEDQDTGNHVDLLA